MVFDGESRRVEPTRELYVQFRCGTNRFSYIFDVICSFVTLLITLLVTNFDIQTVMGFCALMQWFYSSRYAVRYSSRYFRYQFVILFIAPGVVLFATQVDLLFITLAVTFFLLKSIFSLLLKLSLSSSMLQLLHSFSSFILYSALCRSQSCRSATEGGWLLVTLGFNLFAIRQSTFL